MTHDKPPSDPTQEIFHAALLEDSVLVVLRDNQLGPADRAVLERAVFIARAIQKKPKRME